ncbi:MAG: DUF1847 domain-containing protein [Alphaproteobacteria bacterium]|nr:DUF1847 domain-containing protein [Alphaproteobacteria bacterium]
MKEYYTAEELKEMEITYGALNKSRIQELINYAKGMGYRRIGLANCICMQKYIETLANLLKAGGLEVFHVNCREGGLDLCDFTEDHKGSSCDPAYQAAYLNSMNTDLNVNVGLCLGHGLIFQKHSNAPVTTLIVKDFSTKHNPLANLE